LSFGGIQKQGPKWRSAKPISEVVSKGIERFEFWILSSENLKKKRNKTESKISGDFSADFRRFQTFWEGPNSRNCKNMSDFVSQSIFCL
jgi:hypothetical protein